MRELKYTSEVWIDDLGGMQYEVTVIGDEPLDYRRIYTLKATSAKDAAAQARALFDDEVEALGPRVIEG